MVLPDEERCLCIWSDSVTWSAVVWSWLICFSRLCAVLYRWSRMTWLLPRWLQCQRSWASTSVYLAAQFEAVAVSPFSDSTEDACAELASGDLISIDGGLVICQALKGYDCRSFWNAVDDRHGRGRGLILRARNGRLTVRLYQLLLPIWYWLYRTLNCLPDFPSSHPKQTHMAPNVLCFGSELWLRLSVSPLTWVAAVSRRAWLHSVLSQTLVLKAAWVDWKAISAFESGKRLTADLESMLKDAAAALNAMIKRPQTADFLQYLLHCRTQEGVPDAEGCVMWSALKREK